MSNESIDPHQGQPVLRAGAALEKASAAIILIHGRGATAEGMLSLAEERPHPGVAYLAPQAKGNTWYPFSFLAPIQQNEPWLSSALRAVDQVFHEAVGAGISSDRVILLGFSQGACLVSEYAARNPRRYRAVVILSGGLIGTGTVEHATSPDDKLFEYNGSLEGTPVFMGCSDIDAHIPLGRFQQTAEVMHRLGADVDKRIYRGMGHTVNDEERAYIHSLLDDVSGR